MAGKSRRVGDWQNRDHDEANTLAGAPHPKKWYEQTFWIVFLLLVFWPAGVVLAWRSSWHVGFKIAATVLVAITVFLWWNMTQAALQAQAPGSSSF